MNWEKQHLETIPDIHIRGMVSVMYTSYHFNKLMNTILKPYDVSHEQFEVLKILETQYPASFHLKEIQERLVNQTANTTRLVEKLRKKDLVESKQNPENRRQLNIHITEKGLKLLQEIKVPLEKNKNNFNNAISEEEAKQLIKILSKVQTVCVEK